jgi:hypothetical protein
MSGSYQRSVDVFIREALEPAARSRILAATAKRVVGEIISSGRAGPDYSRFVDGREGATEESVRPEGIIIYRWSYLGEIAAFALAFLRERSPVRSGAYRAGFYLGIDGRFVTADRFDPARMGEASEVVIGNVEPYSRKVDVQATGGQRIRFSVPPNLFDDAAKAVRKRFGNIVSARRVYTMQFPGQYALRTGPKKGKRVESPALILSTR